MPTGGGGAKRKRGGDYQYGDSSNGRPSPHRPENLNLARQQNHPQSPTPGSATRSGRHPSNTNNYTNANVSANASVPTPAATPTPKAQPQQQPQSSAPHFHYTSLTQERIDVWQASGRDALIADGATAYKESSYVDLGNIFQELTRAGMDGKLLPSEAGNVVAEILASHDGAADDGNTSGIDGPAYFLDTLSVISSASEQDIANPNLKVFMIATKVSPALMREILEDSMLLALQLVRPTFSKQFIRKQTGILYKQSNYNLLREESEGYSKLVTELFTVSDNEPPSAEVVRDTHENIKAMIGAFDLDPARVVDVTLDIFASLLVKHYRFFVKLLRCSSWWPSGQSFGELLSEEPRFSSLPVWAFPDHSSWISSDHEKEVMAALKDERDIEFWARAREVGISAFFELGGRQAVHGPELEAYLDATEDSSDVRAAETAKWIKDTKTLPPQGNSYAAQLLGFKLRFYASDARDAHDTLPVNLIYLAALLIKIGFISLRDLYPHLYPSDDDMTAVKEKQLKEKQERDAAKRPGGGQLNALARAGALPDDTLPTTLPVTTNRLRDNDRSTTPSRADLRSAAASNSGAKAAPDEDEEGEEKEEKEQLPEPSDQKVQLLRSLLCIGAIPEALYFLGRFPWLVDLFPDIPEHIHRILHYSISKVYDLLCPMKSRDGIRESARTPSHDQAGIPKGGLRLTTLPSPKVLRWAQVDRNDTGDGIDYRFYWDDWNDNVPLCQNVDDIFTLCSTFLNLVGVKIGQDSTLLTKFARIGKHSLKEDTSLENKSRWIDLCKRLLCPALSLAKANPGVVNEMFDLLKMFDTKTRYSIYSEWFVGPTSRLPDIQEAFDLSRAETKDVLKRISKTNTKQMARTLAKVTCASPGVVFAVVLNQIESYDNLIDVVVECGRYFTFMGYDVLTWSLVSTLGRTGRSRIDKDGISTSSWLKVLSSFTGRVFKRYSTMNTLPILQYVLDQLSKGNFTDLRVLRELITSMGGVIPDINFTDPQIQAMAGGELLQSQTLKLMQDKRHESKVSARRLVKTLLDHGLVGAFLVAIAQERQDSLSHSEGIPLKVIGENFDDIQIVLTQFLDMVRSNVPTKEFDTLVPDIVSLISDYGLNASIAFMIHRKSLAMAIDEYIAAQKQAKEKVDDLTAAAANGDVEMTEAADTVEGTSEKKTFETETDVIVEGINGEIANILMSPTEKENIQMQQASVMEEESPWHPTLQDLIEKIRPVLSKKFESTMSVPFFITFWQLSLNDMVAPYQSYDEEIKRHNDRIHHINSDKSDNSTAGQRRKENEKKAVNELLDRVREEMKTQLTSYQLTRKRLMKEKLYWFKGFHGKWARLNTTLLQDCFLPRLLLSPLDAYFAFKMLFFLHSSGAADFLTMHFIDTLFNDKALTNLIYQCTAREAENLGRFLNELLKELSIWHADKASFEKRAYGPNKDLPGFAQLHPQGGPPGNFLTYEHFRQLLFKWHRNLFEALKNCFNTWEYMHIKNAIVVMRSISHYFPAVDQTGEKLYKHVETISNVMRETHRDLWVLANSLMANLKGRKRFWVTVQDFGPESKGQKAANGASQSTPLQTAKPSPAGALKADKPTTKATLSATASEFVPKIAGDGKGLLTGMEDGEVEDGGAIEAAAAKTTTEAENVKTTVNEDSTKQQPAAETSKPLIVDTSKPATNATLPNRAPHALPSRPEVQPPMRARYSDKRTDRLQAPSQPQPQERPDSKQSRDSTTRISRPGDLMQQKLDERRAPSPGRLDSASQAERGSRPSSRGAELSAESAHKITQDSLAPPPRAPPRMNPPRYREPEPQHPAPRGSNLRNRADVSAGPIQQSSNAAPYDSPRERTDSSINPERAALMQQQPHIDETRSGNHSQRGSRTHSPSRRGDSRDYGVGGNSSSSSLRNENHPREQRSELMRPPPYEVRGGSSRQEHPADGHHLNEPRDNRSTYHQSSSRDRDSRPGRMSSQSQDYPPRPPRHDPNYGRLNADPGPPPSPSHSQTRSYDRSAAPTAEREGRLQHRGASPPSTHQNGPRPPRERSSRQSEASVSAESRDSKIQSSSATPDVAGMHPDRLKLVELQGPAATAAAPAAPSPSGRQPRQEPVALASAATPVGPRTAGSRPPPQQQHSASASRNTPIGPANARPDRRQRIEESPPAIARTPVDTLDRRIRGRASETSLENPNRNPPSASSSMEPMAAQSNGTGPNLRHRIQPPRHIDSQRDDRRDGGRLSEREPPSEGSSIRARDSRRDLMDFVQSPAAAPDRNGAPPPYDSARSHRSSRHHPSDSKEPPRESRGEYMIRGQTAHNEKGREREHEHSPTRPSRSERQYRERDHLVSSGDGHRDRDRREYDLAPLSTTNNGPAGGPPPRLGPSSRRASDNNLNGSGSGSSGVPPHWQQGGSSDRRAGGQPAPLLEARRDFSSSGRKRGWQGDEAGGSANAGDGGSSRAASMQQSSQQQQPYGGGNKRLRRSGN